MHTRRDDYLKKNKTFNNTLYCIKYIWKIDAKYILLMVVISVLTSIFNIINLSILRYITETLMKRATAYFLGVIGVMFLLSVTIAIINGSLKFGIRVEDGTAMKEEIRDSYAELILCTGSTLCNGSIIDYLDLDKDVLFFGTTASGAAPLLGLKRVCFADKYE